MSKRYKQGLVLFMILVFPSLLYVVLSGSNHDIVGLPYYGPKKVDANGDTVYYETSHLNELKVYPQGNAVRDQLKGTVKIINFIDFTPESYRVMEQMQNLAERFNDKPDVVLITILQNTPSDSLLSALKQTYHVAQGLWILAESSSDLMGDLKTQEQKVVDATAQHVITLVDQENKLRGYFDGIQYVDTKEIREAVKALRFKNYRPVKSKNTDERE